MPRRSIGGGVVAIGAGTIGAVTNVRRWTSSAEKTSGQLASRLGGYC